MPEKDAKPRRKAGHKKIAWLLIGLATFLAIFAIFSIWANRQALNTDNWVNTSDKLLANPEIQTQLSNYLAAQLLANVDVEGELSKSLPPQLQALAAPAASGLTQLAPQIAMKALASPQVQQLWSAANRTAHQTLLQILDGGGTTVSTNGGEVTLDLGAVLTQVGGNLGVGSNLVSKIPPGAGKLTVLRSDQISTAQDVASGIRHLPIVLTLLVLLLYGLAIYLAGPDRRRRTLRSVGLGFIVAGVLVLILRGVAGDAVVNGLVANHSVRPAAQAVWSIGTSLLVTVASSAIAFGILIVIGAWIAGPTRLARALRQEASPHMRENRAAVYAVAVVVYLVLIAWAPITAFHKPWGIILFAVLFAIGVEALRRQSVREFPDTRTDQAGEGLREWWAGLFGGSGASSSSSGAEVGELERLSTLHRSGDLSDTEFEAAKARILAAQSGS
jgi:hypothetical protein